jgi:hypothetical protein
LLTVFLLTLQAPPPPAPAAEPPAMGEMTVDRPDFTDSPDVIGRGLWQVESGLLFSSIHIDAATIHETIHEIVTPQALLRIGVSPRLELRVAADGWLSDTTSQPGVGRLSGRSDVAVSVKWRLFDEQRPGGFDVALLPILSLPAGSGSFSSGGYDPTLKLAWAHPLPHDIDLSGNFVIASLTDNDRRFVQETISVCAEHALAAGWSGYAELLRTSAVERDGRNVWLFDTGVSRGLGQRVAIDMSVGRGLSDAAPAWYVGAGVAWRGLFRHSSSAGR